MSGGAEAWGLPPPFGSAVESVLGRFDIATGGLNSLLRVLGGRLGSVELCAQAVDFLRRGAGLRLGFAQARTRILELLARAAALVGLRCLSTGPRRRDRVTGETGDDVESARRLERLYEAATGEQLSSFLRHRGRAQRLLDLRERGAGGAERLRLPQQAPHCVHLLLPRAFERVPLVSTQHTRLRLTEPVPRVEQKIDVAAMLTRESIQHRRSDGRLLELADRVRIFTLPGRAQLLHELRAFRNELRERDAVEPVDRVVEGHALMMLLRSPPRARPSSSSSAPGCRARAPAPRARPSSAHPYPPAARAEHGAACRAPRCCAEAPPSDPAAPPLPAPARRGSRGPSPSPRRPPSTRPYTCRGT